MADNSLFAMLLRSPWWISIAIALALAIAAMALLPAAYRVVGAISGLPFVVVAVLAAVRQRRAPNPALVARTHASVAAMTWPVFAKALEDAFRRDGYSVQRGSAAPVDFVLERNGRRMFVSARRWKSARLGVELLRTLQAARAAADVSDVLCISLGGPSDSARAFADEHGVTLWQAAELARTLRDPARPSTPRR